MPLNWFDPTNKGTPKPEGEPSVSVADDALDEHSRVLLWRCEQLEALGLDKYVAAAIAAGDADLNRVRAAFKKGAGPDQIRGVFL